MRRIATPEPLYLLLADASCAARYRPDLLDAADAARIAAAPRLAGRADWQVSRFLKQQAGLPVLSLSHSKGAALLAAGWQAENIGVDIEWLQARDFAALSALWCRRSEQQWLAVRGWRAADYYRLWCVKEALIKAAGLDFPAALADVGLMMRAGSHVCLHVHGHAGWHGVAGLNGGWASACVWPAHKNVQIEWRRFGAFRRPEQAWRDVWTCVSDAAVMPV
ncbi:4'-phosphopantetheinyl transferase superfamily protein [Uruburuella testudinis]|uniref:4'-phosphopantetheinyl transferase superfamily protein n=1 Tax=Uruburuella testudinis TaxID=1282863 RepID=A0ABY4DQX3_9NEIS|nr:4'-phosphopantetheinyl transferase superfamily protein [Uruburuella testudinis]UOO81134.1 4'-phosphopantetheinyl transferase superfamily protein [Uruburuella testudinis]